MTESSMEESEGGPSSTNIFFSKRASFDGVEYYANGALLYKPDIPAVNGIIHVTDRVLEPIIQSKIYSYVQQPDPARPSVRLKFSSEITNYLTGAYYSQTITPLQISRKLTLFVPTDAAISKIPAEKLEELRSRQAELARVIQNHAIAGKAVYTSLVNDNEGYDCLYGRAIFKKKKESVYVTAGGVTAEITHGNMTLSNGVIHFVDAMLGYIYMYAREQIQQDAQLRQFSQLLARGRKDLQDFPSQPAGVTIFVPINKTFDSVLYPPWVNFDNQTLINMVLELHMLEPGTELQISSINGDYKARFEALTQYKGRNVKIYRQGDETWVEAGYVKARVIRPDVAVTNGYIQYVDALFGVPTKDVLGVMEYEEWLRQSAKIFVRAGLDRILEDSRLPRHHIREQVYNTTEINNNCTRTISDLLISDICGGKNELCQFTVFVPNGTKLDDFWREELKKDREKLRLVLLRHIVVSSAIYIDQLSIGEHEFVAADEEVVQVKKFSEFYAEVVFENKRRARIIHPDFGATNGVVHIIDDVLFNPDDLTREVCNSSETSTTDSSETSTTDSSDAEDTTPSNIETTDVSAVRSTSTISTSDCVPISVNLKLLVVLFWLSCPYIKFIFV